MNAEEIKIVKSQIFILEQIPIHLEGYLDELDESLVDKEAIEGAANELRDVVIEEIEKLRKMIGEE